MPQRRHKHLHENKEGRTSGGYEKVSGWQHLSQTLKCGYDLNSVSLFFSLQYI